MKDSFILYTSYYQAVMQLSDAQAGQLLKAIYQYVYDGTKAVIVDPTVSFAFSIISATIGDNLRKYEERCEKNRENIRKRWGKTNTNVYDGIRTYTNVYDGIPNDMICNDMICNEDTNVSNNIISFPKEKDKSKNKFLNSSSSSVGKIYEEVMEYWNKRINDAGSVMPKARLTDRRKATINARLREVGNDKTLLFKMIDKAVASDFLNGKNSREKVFNFDGLFAPNMFTKTLEGNFDNYKGKGQASEAQPASKPWNESLQTSKSKRKTETERLREYYQGCIIAVKDNPKSMALQPLLTAYNDGTLKRIGIEWQPEKS